MTVDGQSNQAVESAVLTDIGQMPATIRFYLAMVNSWKILLV